MDIDPANGGTHVARMKSALYSIRQAVLLFFVCIISGGFSLTRADSIIGGVSTFAFGSSLFNGNLTFLSDATLQLDVNTSTSAIGQFVVTGNLSLNSTNLELIDFASPAQTLAWGSGFVLVNYGGTVTGEFKVDGNLIPEDGTFQDGNNIFQLDYAANNSEITAMAVPEPRSLLLGILCFLPLVFVLAFRSHWRVSASREQS